MPRCRIPLHEAVRAQRTLDTANARKLSLEPPERRALAEVVMAFDYDDQCYLSTVLTAQRAMDRVLGTDTPPPAPAAAAPRPELGELIPDAGCFEREAS